MCRRVRLIVRLGRGAGKGKLQYDLTVLGPAGVTKPEAQIEVLWASRGRNERDLQQRRDTFVPSMCNDQLHRRPTDAATLAIAVDHQTPHPKLRHWRRVGTKRLVIEHDKASELV